MKGLFKSLAYTAVNRYNTLHVKMSDKEMYLNDLLTEKNISKYRLAKDSGVPQTTILDICAQRTNIIKCSVETIYKIAKVLDVPMEKLIEEEMTAQSKNNERLDFEVFKSNVCHLVKDKGDTEFIIEALSSDEIGMLYRKKWYAEAFYMLGMVDYLSRENHVPICTKYNDIRGRKLKECLYPVGVSLSDMAMNTDANKKECLKKAIPEFLRFNIVECEVRNVC